MIRRDVRATPDFFAKIDLQLPDERGPDGEPSWVDFQAYGLLAIVERFAMGWDDLPELVPGRPDYRILITTGRIAPMISVVGQLAADGAIELVDVDIDLRGPWKWRRCSAAAGWWQCATC